MPGHLNRRRATHLMQHEGLSALVLCQPESITYASGAFAGVATFWRRAGAAFVIIPLDDTLPPTAIVGDLQAASFAQQSGFSQVLTHRIWVETDSFPDPQPKPARSPRPAQYDLSESLQLLRDVLQGLGLEDQRIGLELGFVPAADFEAFKALPFKWVDCTRVVEKLRAIKSPTEIALLRRAAQHASAGLTELVQAITPGMTAADMTRIWVDAAKAHARQQGEAEPQSTWAYIAVGGDGFAPGGPAQPGDVIKIDVGCVINGYSSDGARSVVLGTPHPEAQRRYDALHRAFDAGLAMFRPGVPLRNIYREVATTMWNQGYETYGRGHFGHGVGASIWSEEWPFIADDADAVLEPGMVMAFETPWYVEGLGGLIIEDQLLVTDSGFEIMAPLPRQLLSITC